MKKYLSTHVIVFALFFAFAMGSGHVAYAEPIVPCGNGSDECTVCHLQVLAMNIVDFIVLLATIFATLLFVNAGALYVLSPANPGNIAKAHRIFMTALVGFILILSSWLIVNLIMSQMFNKDVFAEWNNMLCS